MSDITPTQELNLHGSDLSGAMARLKTAIGRCSGGGVLRATGTDLSQLPRIRAWLRSAGHDVVEERERGGEFVLLIRVA